VEWQKTGSLEKYLIIHEEKGALVVLENGGLKPEQPHNLTLNGRERRNIIINLP
jgi:hypothetical protein